MQPDIEQIVAEARAWHKKRVFAMESRKRGALSLGAFLRTQMGWRRDMGEPERKAIAAGVAKLINCGEKVVSGKEHVLEDTAEYQEWRLMIEAAIMSHRHWNVIEDDALKGMVAVAKKLPVWTAFGESIRGFGAASLGVIVAEAGDLSNYATHSKLWKRMGLAVMEGVRQGGLPKNASADDWIAHGYNRQRRSRMWNIGDTMIKGNRDGVYRTIYLTRKAYEIARAPEMKPMQAHRRAQRYMEKRLLRDLWRAWRRDGRQATDRMADPLDGPIHKLPAAQAA